MLVFLLIYRQPFQSATPSESKTRGTQLGGSRRFDFDRWIQLFEIAVEEIIAVDHLPRVLRGWSGLKGTGTNPSHPRIPLGGTRNLFIYVYLPRAQGMTAGNTILKYIRSFL